MPVYQRYVSLGFESTYGVAVTPSVHLDCASEGLELRRDTRFAEADRRMAADRTYSPGRSVGGTLDVYAGWEKLGYLLKALLGLPATTTPEGSARSHLYTPTLQRSVPSGTWDAHREIARHRYTGLFPRSGRVSFASPEHFGVSLAMLGADEALGSSGSVNDSDFETTIFPLTNAGGGTGEAALTATFDDGSTSWSADFEALDVEFSFDRALRRAERSLTPTGILTRGQIGAELRLRWIYGTDTQFLYDAYRDEVDLDVDVRLTGGIISGATSYLLQLQLPKMRVTGKTPTVKKAGHGDIAHDVPLSALYDSTLLAPFTVTLVNTTGSYA
jgi:hypothetical protein